MNAETIIKTTAMLKMMDEQIRLTLAQPIDVLKAFGNLAASFNMHAVSDLIETEIRKRETPADGRMPTALIKIRKPTRGALILIKNNGG
jgi:hypothetical protein